MSTSTRLPLAGGWSRRDVLLGGAAAALALARSAAAQDAAPPACVLTPQLTEGPYYIDRPRLRRDITEGRPGIPLILHVQLLDAATCRPLRGAAVDVWHCDAAGVYSGYDGETPGFPGPPPGAPPSGEFGPAPSPRHGPPPVKPAADNPLRFLRGVQLTGADGVAAFRTIVPGWYVGRAVHIHLKAHTGGRALRGRYAGGHVCHTGQFGFADEFYAPISVLPPYARHPAPRTLLRQDGILGANGPVLRLAPLGDEPGEGYLGTIRCAVDARAIARVV